jgi:Predicted ICC-like phosphoesterases
MTPCEIAGERLVLLPERAAYWPARSTLFVADFHLGKAASFRSAGIPLPSGTTTENVERLGRAIDRTDARHVVFLGDFLHSAEARAPRTLGRFAEWRAARGSVALTLVRGNHDRKAGDPPEWNIACVEAGASLGPFVLNHEPGSQPRGLRARRAHPSGRAPLRGRRILAAPAVLLVRAPPRRAAGIRRLHRQRGRAPQRGRPGLRDRGAGSPEGRLKLNGVRYLFERQKGI